MMGSLALNMKPLVDLVMRVVDPNLRETALSCLSYLPDVVELSSDVVSRAPWVKEVDTDKIAKEGRVAEIAVLSTMMTILIFHEKFAALITLQFPHAQVPVIIDIIYLGQVKLRGKAPFFSVLSISKSKDQDEPYVVVWESEMASLAVAKDVIRACAKLARFSFSPWALAASMLMVARR